METPKTWVRVTRTRGSDRQIKVALKQLFSNRWSRQRRQRRRRRRRQRRKRAAAAHLERWTLISGKPFESRQRTFTVEGRITVLLVSSLTRLTLIKEENMLLFVCREAVESRLGKLETCCTVIPPPTVNVL